MFLNNHNMFVCLRCVCVCVVGCAEALKFQERPSMCFQTPLVMDVNKHVKNDLSITLYDTKPYTLNHEPPKLWTLPGSIIWMSDCSCCFCIFPEIYTGFTAAVVLSWIGATSKFPLRPRPKFKQLVLTCLSLSAWHHKETTHSCSYMPQTLGVWDGTQLLLLDVISS